MRLRINLIDFDISLDFVICKCFFSRRDIFNWFCFSHNEDKLTLLIIWYVYVYVYIHILLLLLLLLLTFEKKHFVYINNATKGIRHTGGNQISDLAPALNEVAEEKSSACVAFDAGFDFCISLFDFW